MNRELLWDTLGKCGCPPRFVSVLRDFYDSIMARVISVGLESEPFEVLVGVKQGCVLVPVLFNLFLAAATLLVRNGISRGDSVAFNYGLDGSLFNPHHLKTKSKVTTSSLFELLYANDTALVSHTAHSNTKPQCPCRYILEVIEVSCQPFFDLGYKINEV